MVEVNWGPDGEWGLWVGEGVLDGLVSLLDQHLAIPKSVCEPFPENSSIITSGDRWHEPGPAALGVVPWLDHPEIADRLARMECCVVVDKEPAVLDAVTRLHEQGIPFPSEAITGFHEDMAPVDSNGQPFVVGPNDPSDWPPRPQSIGPVRVWGYRGRPKPLPHLKVVVLGTVARFKNYAYPEVGPPEYLRFLPEVAWSGSANWTRRSAEHLEMGSFVTDPAFLQTCFQYVSSVVLESEPLGSPHAMKVSEMRPVEYDDKAFLEYLAEQERK